MRITIEIPDDQIPESLLNEAYPSGIDEDALHDLLINYSINHLSILTARMATKAKEYISRENLDAFTELQAIDIEFLRLLQQNMKIESGDSKEKVLIDGLTEVAKDWYDGCPKSMKFVTKVLQLLKSYNRNSDET